MRGKGEDTRSKRGEGGEKKQGTVVIKMHLQQGTGGMTAKDIC